MTILLLWAMLFGDGESIRYEVRGAPTGLRITKVVLGKYQPGARARVDVSGRYSGYENGRVYFDFSLKNTGRVIANSQPYVDVVRNEKFSKTIYVSLNDEPKSARAFFKFGELRPR